MKNFKQYLIALVAALALGSSAFAQVTLTSTTLSVAVTTGSARTINVTSATGFVANSTQAFVDAELMDVQAVSGTLITVRRGAGGTRATTHASSATIYVGPANYFSSYDRFGSCTSGNELVLPVINTANAKGFQCAGGQWLTIFQGTMNTWNAGTQPNEIRSFCTGTAGSAETEYLYGAACSGATTSLGGYIADAAGTLATLRVASSANATGGSSKDVATVYKNGSSTALTCTIAGAAKICSDTTHSVAVAAGDVITFQFVTATSDTAANMAVAVQKY